MESSSVTSEIDSDAIDCCTKKELRQQISMLQNAVTEMKTAFTTAVQQLRSVQYQDHGLQEQIQQNKVECQDQIAEVVKLILSLQAEFGSIKCQMQQIQEAQCCFQQQFQGLLVDQDLLIDELRKSASISEQFRHQFKCSRELRSSTGSQSNDSGVALLLERAQAGFSHFGFPTVSDHDSASIPESSPLLVTSMVRDYVAGLGQSAISHVCGELEPDALNYDSDSSLVIAANKSLTLSSSLGKQCGLELQHEGSSEDEEEELTEDRRPYASLTDDKRNLSQLAKSDAAARALSEKSYPYILKKRRQYLSPAPDGVPSLIQDPHYLETQRLQVSKTILETERKYCKKLWVLQDAYLEPLKRNGIVSSKDFNTLFPEEIFKLYEKHCIMLHKLEERIQAWQWNGLIGDIVLNFISSDESCILHLYTSYVNDFPEVLKTFYKLCRHSEQFTKFLKEKIKHPSCVGSDLTEFLLIPVQRIPIYIIHLKRILKYTTFDHPDYESIRSCLNRLRDFLARLNDSMEHSFQLMTAQLAPQVDLSHNLKSSTFSLKTVKPNFREPDVVESSSDNESIGQDKRTQQLRRKTFMNSSRESVSYDKTYPRKHKDKANLVPSTKACADEITATSSSSKNFNNRHSSSSLLSCDQAKSQMLSKSPENRLTRQPALFNDFDDPQVENFETKNSANARCCTSSFSSFQQSSGELADDDSIFNDRMSITSKNESLNICSKACYSPSVTKSIADENPEVNGTIMNLNMTSSSSKSLNSSTESANSKPPLEVKSNNNEENSSPYAESECHADNANFYDDAISCKDKFSRSSNLGRSPKISGSHVDLASTPSGQVRPLIKFHSSHAVHQLLKEQNSCSSHKQTPILCKASASEDIERRKAKSKSEKKRVSLRSLKSMFFRKRGFVNNMRTVEMGTCTSHDELSSPNWENSSMLSSDRPT